MRALLPQLHYFITVAKLRSFTRAAEELNISQSAISYQIKKLEDRLGTQLLIRDSRNRTSLTQQGEQLAECGQEIFTLLAATLENINGHTLQGTLAISADTCLGTLVLAPATKNLHQRYPKLRIELHITETFLDLATHNIDIAIRTARDDPRLAYEPLFHTRMVLVAARSYLQPRAPIRKLQDLANHCLLRMGEDDYDWRELTARRPELQLPPLTDTIHISSALALAEAARAGVGIAYLPAYTVAKELQEGNMQELLPELFREIDIPYYAAYPARAAGSAKIMGFIQQLREYLQQTDFAGAFRFA